MKYTLPFATLLVALLCCCQPAQAVENVPDTTTLLWRISGKGLAKPSYLYGTMHLRDHRIFDFADSVMPHFDKCEGFAMESLPDSLMALLAYSYNYDLSLSEKVRTDDTTRLPLVPDPEAGSFLSTVKSSWGYSHLLTEKKNQYPTILDFYLYRLARNQGKVASSLESPTEIYRWRMKRIREQYTRTEGGENSQVGEDENFMGMFAEFASTLMIGKMIRLYREGRIDDLLAISQISMGGTNSDYLLTQRNIGMAREMKRLMHERSTFVAVGTAHLGGKHGLIEMLRGEGYTVTPVPEVRNEPADVLRDDLAVVPWRTYSPATAGYSIEFPDTPTRLPLDLFRNTSAEFNTVIYPELTSSIMYISSYTDVLKSRSPEEIDRYIDSCMASYISSSGPAESEEETPEESEEGTGEEEEKELDDATKRLANLLGINTQPRKRAELVKEETLKGDIRGKRISVRMSDSSFHTLQYSTREGRLFILLTLAPSDTLYPKEQQRFFSSFKTTGTTAARPTVFSSVRGAYSVSFPDQLDTIAGQAEGSVWVSDTAIACSDRSNGILYRTGFMPADASSNESTYMILLSADTDLPDPEMLITDTTSVLPVYTAIVPGSLDTVRYRLIRRGMRMYYLVADIPAGVPVSASDAVFDSFRTVEFAAAATEKLDVDSLGFAVVMPGKEEDDGMSFGMDDLLQMGSAMRLGSDSLLYTVEFDKSTTDANSGASYRLRVLSLGRYFYAKDMDNLLVRTENIVFGAMPTNEYSDLGDEGEVEDSTAPQRNVRSLTVNSFPARLLYDSSAVNRRNMMVALRGNRLYVLTASVSAERSDSLQFERYVASLRLDPDTTKPSIFTSRAAELLEEVRNGTISRPGTIVSQYPFSAADLPHIYSTLRTPVSDDESMYISTRFFLLKAVADFKDSTTLPFLVELIPTLGDTPKLQYKAVEILAEMDTQEAVAELARLLPDLRVPEGESYGTGILSTLYSNPEYARILLPAVLALADRDGWQGDVYSLVETVHGNGTLTPSDLQPVRNVLYTNLTKHLALYRASETGEGTMSGEEDGMNYYEAYNLALKEIALLAIFRNDEEITDALTELSHDATFGETAVLALLRNNHELDLSDYDELTAQPYRCLSLYRSLSNSGLERFFPPIDNAQETMAQALVEEYMADEGMEVAPEFRLIATREIADGPEAGRYFLFGVFLPNGQPSDEDSRGENEERWLAVVSGPQPLDPTQFSTEWGSVYTRYDTLDEKNANTQFEELMAASE